MTTTRLPKKPEAIRAWFNYQLKLNKSSFAAVGRSIGVSRQAVRKSVLRPSPRLADAIAAALNEKRENLWPELYQPSESISAVIEGCHIDPEL